MFGTIPRDLSPEQTLTPCARPLGFRASAPRAARAGHGWGRAHAVTERLTLSPHRHQQYRQPRAEPARLLAFGLLLARVRRTQVEPVLKSPRQTSPKLADGKKITQALHPALRQSRCLGLSYA